MECCQLFRSVVNREAQEATTVKGALSSNQQPRDQERHKGNSDPNGTAGVGCRDVHRSGCNGEPPGASLPAQQGTGARNGSNRYLRLSRI